jgi:hypothetical protein
MPGARGARIRGDASKFLGHLSRLPDWMGNPSLGKLCFIISPNTVDRCVRILLSGVADLPPFWGCLDRDRQQRGPADGYPAAWTLESFTLRQPDPDLQRVPLVSVLCQLIDESNAKRKH